MEQLGALPDIGAIAINADGNVAFENNAIGMRILRSLFQLQVQVILNEIMEPDVVVSLRAFRAVSAASSSSVARAMGGPLVKVRRAVLVAQIAKGRVRHQPMFVLLKKLLVILAPESLVLSARGRFA